MVQHVLVDNWTCGAISAKNRWSNSWLETELMFGWTTFPAVKSHIFDRDLSWCWSPVRPAAEVFFFLNPLKQAVYVHRSSKKLRSVHGEHHLLMIKGIWMLLLCFFFSVRILKVPAAQFRISAAAQQIGALWVTTPGLNRCFPQRGLFMTSELNRQWLCWPGCNTHNVRPPGLWHAAERWSHSDGIRSEVSPVPSLTSGL